MVVEERNIVYVSENSKGFNQHRHLLDVFYNKESQNSAVLVFIHGGTWMNGSKDIYRPFGRHLAEKGVTSVTINYRLGNLVNFSKMAEDCASAVKWVYTHIEKFNGDRSKISVSGHSAGGHLASLIALDPEYFDQLRISNPIKKVVLIDAFGLNIGKFILEHGAFYRDYIERVFTRDPHTWKKASPVNFIAGNDLPFFITTGSRTHPFLLQDNELFIHELKKNGRTVNYETIAGKSHVEMITQLENPRNPLYEKIIHFVEGQVRHV